MSQYATTTRTFDTIALYASALLGGLLTPNDRRIAARWYEAARRGICTFLLHVSDWNDVWVEWADTALRLAYDAVWSSELGTARCVCDLCTTPDQGTAGYGLPLVPFYEVGIVWCDATPYPAYSVTISNRHTDEDQAVTGSVWLAEVDEPADATATHLDLTPINALTVDRLPAAPVVKTLCLPTDEEMAAMKVKHLRDLASDVGVAIRGTKAQLIARIKGKGL